MQAVLLFDDRRILNNLHITTSVYNSVFAKLPYKPANSSVSREYTLRRYSNTVAHITYCSPCSRIYYAHTAYVLRVYSPRRVKLKSYSCYSSYNARYTYCTQNTTPLITYPLITSNSYSRVRKYGKGCGGICG